MRHLANFFKFVVLQGTWTKIEFVHKLINYFNKMISDTHQNNSWQSTVP